MLGEIGGLFSLLYSIGSMLINFTKFNKIENYLVHRIYSYHSRADRLEDRTIKVSDNELQSRLFVKEYLQYLLPEFCLKSKCLKRKKEDIYFEKARNRLNKELDLINVIRLLRYFNASTNLSNSIQIRESLVKKVRKLPVYDDDPKAVIEKKTIESQ